jgi:branched-chain amino acid transport system permease protein
LLNVVVAGLAEGAVFGLFALGLVLVYKATRVLNFAQSEIGAASALLTWWLVVKVGVPWLVAAGAALLAAAVIGLVFERLVVRQLIAAPRMTVVVATVAAGLFLAAAELQLWGVGPFILPSPFHGRGLHLGDVFLSPPRVLAIVVTSAAAAGAAWFFRRTTFGLALLAAAQDSVGVRLTGIRLRHLSAFTWAVSSVVGGLVGIIIALSLGAFAPLFMSHIMLFGFAAAVLGGMTSLPGALLGGIAVGVVKGLVGHWWFSVPGLAETLMFGVIVAMLLVRPQGILGSAA